MAGEDSKVNVWDKTTIEGQPYFHSAGIEDRLPGYSPPGGDLVLTGTIAHGNTVTITTDGTYNFGTRTNATPLYVYAGENDKNGSSLGRVTTNRFTASVAYFTDYAVGGFAGGMAIDHKATSQELWGGLQFDPSKTLFVAGLRYRDLELLAGSPYNGPSGLNLKTHRLWATGGPGGPNNFYIGYQGSSSGDCRGFAENTGATARYYPGNMPFFEHHNELLTFKGSSAVDVEDARFRHYINGEWLNVPHPDTSADRTLTTSKSTTNSTDLQYLYLDQVSNGAGSGVDNVYNVVVSLIVDDEPRQIWIGNASTIEACTDKYPIPTAAWSSTQAQAVYWRGTILAEDTYFYVQTGYNIETGERTWLRSEGLR